MKRYIFGFLFIGIFGSTGFSQRGMQNERIKEFKWKFFNENLALTESEQKAFWPIYGEYEKAKEDLKRKMKRNKNAALIPDTELEEFINQHLDFEQKQLDLKREFIENIKTVLPIRKVAAIPKTEQEFKKKILEEMRKRRQQRRERMGN